MLEQPCRPGRCSVRCRLALQRPVGSMGRAEDSPSGSPLCSVESSSDVCQPRSSACATVVLRAINGSAVEEFVLSFSGSISCFWPSRRAAAGGCRTPVPVGLAGSPGSEWSFSSPCPVPAGIFQPSGFIPSRLSLS